MESSADSRRLPGGNMPTSKLACTYLFSPLLLTELSALDYQKADLAARNTEEARRARLNLNKLQAACQISLPPLFTIPAQKIDRVNTGGFSMVFNRKLFSRIKAELCDPTDNPDHLRYRNAVEQGDVGAIWESVLEPNFGKAYSLTPTYEKLAASLATVVAGLGLFLSHHWFDEGRALAEDAHRIWLKLDIATMKAVADRTGVSFGVVLAVVIQLAARKGCEPVRAALLKDDWVPFHRALWGFLPGYEGHPWYKLFLKKLEDPNVKTKVGRPSAAVITTPPAPARTSPTLAGKIEPAAPKTQSPQSGGVGAETVTPSAAVVTTPPAPAGTSPTLVVKIEPAAPKTQGGGAEVETVAPMPPPSAQPLSKPINPFKTKIETKFPRYPS